MSLQAVVATLEFFEDGQIFNENHPGIRMGQNVNQLIIRNVRSPRDIRGAGEQDPVVAQHPFQAVVSDQPDMVSRLDSEGNQRGGKI